tara:strand:+ start:5968 stop:6336 length:369 start_codon:yes stop_codon:yes gene_type:complete
MAKEESVWSIDDLIALTDEVQEGECEYRGKSFRYQYCELTEKEEPKTLPIDDSASEDEKSEWYTKVGTERIIAMIEKANEKNPDGVTITEEVWVKLPITLRYNVMSDILSISKDQTANFQTG